MYKKIKRIIACFLATALFIPAGQLVVSSDTTEETVVSDTESSTEDDDDDKYVMRTEKEVLEQMILATENDSFKFYYSEEEDLLALVNKKNNYIWWSSPINAEGDENAKGLVKKEIASSMVILYGEPAKRTTSTMRSAKNGKMTYKVSGDTLKVTYRYPAADFKIPVEYTLEEDGLSAKIVTSEIEEETKNDADGKILLEISLLPNITSFDSETEGYYVIPDGSGALINFNNGKLSAREYTAKVYGSDITSVPQNKPAVTEQVYLPVYGAVAGSENGMLAVIHEGDSNAQISANVSGLSKSSYNLCSATFIVRTTDTYYMNGEPLTVFEKRDIKTPVLEMKFCPISDEKVDYIDIAEKYREYLTKTDGVKPAENDISLYLDVYGGVEKVEPVLGIPVTRKKSVTSFEQTKEIVQKLVDGGADSIVLGYNNWTDDGIENKVDYDSKPSSLLGSKKKFKSMLSYFKDNNVDFYPVVNNKTFETGNGYWSFTDTALRASGQYSKQISYNLAYGTENEMKDPISLLSPDVFGEIFDKLAKNYSKAGFSGVCIDDMTSVLYGDYSKDTIVRNDMMLYIEEGLRNCREKVGSVLADTANAYVFKYTDHITNVPLSSSRFDIFDKDIPFYQMVMHGLIPYSTTSVNGSADSEQLFLKAVASGSNLHFDLVYEDTSELKDTEYDIYYYANHRYWTDTITGEYKLLKDVLGGVKNEFITGYLDNGDETVTTYSNGTKITVNYETGEISLDDSVYKLTDYIDLEGELIF